MTPIEVDDALRMRYDALNQAIALAEQKLRGMKPPHNVWIVVSVTLEPKAHTVQLGFAKLDGVWRLAYGETYSSARPVLKPLTDVPLITRIGVITGDNLRLLHEAIVEAKEEFVPEVEAAIRTVEEFLRG